MKTVGCDAKFCFCVNFLRPELVKTSLVKDNVPLQIILQCSLYTVRFSVTSGSSRIAVFLQFRSKQFVALLRTGNQMFSFKETKCKAVAYLVSTSNAFLVVVIL